MARPITLFTIQWGDLSLEEVCKLAKQMGFEGLELSAAHIDMRKAAVDKAYVEEVKATLKKYDLGCWAMSHHLAGQCVCDTLPGAYDSRLDGFAPAELAGKPELIQKWGIEEMMATAHAAQNMGVKVVTFFMGSPITDRTILHQPYPLVIVGDYDTQGLADWVTMPNVEAVRTAVGALLDSGCRRIALIGGTAENACPDADRESRPETTSTMRRASMMVCTPAFASSRLLQISTPFPRARPSALMTVGN